MKIMISLGSKFKDRISGVKGIAIGRSEYLYTSPQIQMGITEMDSNGKPNEPYWLHEAQVEVIEVGDGKPLGLPR